jgi:hypothetical protein
MRARVLRREIMPVLLSVHHDRRLAYFRLCGIMRTIENARSMQYYLKGPDFDPGYVLLGDSSQLEDVETSFAATLAQVMLLEPMLRKMSRDTQIVMYARTEGLFGLARMLQQTVNTVTPVQYLLHRDEAAALAAARQPERSFADLRHALGLDRPTTIPDVAVFDSTTV